MCTTDRHDGSCPACETDEWVVPGSPSAPTPTLKPGDRVTVRWGDATRTFTVPRPTQEPDMPAKDRHDELVALLTEIRDRLPEPPPGYDEWIKGVVDDDLIARNLDALKHEAETPMREHGECCEPAPAADLTGEPVEPGDLRAGDRVGLTFMGERITCTLVSSPVDDALRSDTPDRNDYYPSVTLGGREWCPGTFDVRLIERAPREDKDPDDALAKVLWNFEDEWEETGRESFIRMARAAREHIEQEIPEELDKIGITWQSRARRMGKRAEKAEAAVERLTRERDEAVRVAGAHAADARHWQQCYDAAEYQTEQAVKRHESLRADDEREHEESPDYPTSRILDADDKRGRDA